MDKIVGYQKATSCLALHVLSFNYDNKAVDTGLLSLFFTSTLPSVDGFLNGNFLINCALQT